MKFICSSLQRRSVAPSLSSRSSPKITLLNLNCLTSVASAKAGSIFAIDFKLEDNLLIGFIFHKNIRDQKLAGVSKGAVFVVCMRRFARHAIFWMLLLGCCRWACADV